MEILNSLREGYILSQIRWFEKITDDKDNLILVAFDGSQSVGLYKVFNIDWINHHYDLSYDVFKKHRGKGYGYKVLEAGVDLYGFDISQGMLDIFEEKVKKKKLDIKGRFKKADMRSFKFNKKFDLIIIPYRAFLHNLTPEDQIATLNQCYKHLKKGGKLIVNFFFPNPYAMVEKIGKSFKETDIIIKRKDFSVRLIIYAKHDYTKQQLSLQYIFKVKRKGEKMKEFIDEFALTWIGVNEFKHLAARAGFKIKHLFGDFNKSKKLNNPSCVSFFGTTY